MEFEESLTGNFETCFDTSKKIIIAQEDERNFNDVYYKFKYANTRGVFAEQKIIDKVVVDFIPYHKIAYIRQLKE